MIESCMMFLIAGKSLKLSVVPKANGDIKNIAAYWGENRVCGEHVLLAYAVTGL